jgi:hypothetical protein
MNNLKVIIIVTVFLVAISAPNVMAQGKSLRSRGAQAAYGYPSDYNYKAKKKKKAKRKKQPKAKKNKADKKQPAYRKKNPWAN